MRKRCRSCKQLAAVFWCCDQSLILRVCDRILVIVFVALYQNLVVRSLKVKVKRSTINFVTKQPFLTRKAIKKVYSCLVIYEVAPNRGCLLSFHYFPLDLTQVNRCHFVVSSRRPSVFRSFSPMCFKQGRNATGARSRAQFMLEHAKGGSKNFK